jgi:ribosome-binding factor A
MKANRITRVNELIKRELGTQLYHVINRPDFDPATVTITHPQTSVDLRSCRVLVSIRGDETEQERVLSILKRHRADFQAVLSKNVILRYTPQLRFVIDHSIEEGDQVLQLLQQMEATGEMDSTEDFQVDDDTPPTE